MSTVTDPVAIPSQGNGAIADECLYRLTVEQYHEMVRIGILQSGAPVELLEGLLVKKMTTNPPHRIAAWLVRDALTKLVPAGWYVDAAAPVTTSDSEPEPDTAVIRGHTRDYPDRHPGPADVAMLVEVSDTSLQRDEIIKKRIYARSRMPVYWIVNLPENRIEVYTNPSGPAAEPTYATCQHFGPDDQLAVVIDGNEIGRLTVRDLLP